MILGAAKETQAELKTQAKITQAEAEKTALAKVPNGKIKAAELEKEHGKLIWSFDISMPKSKNITEIQVDAKTGKIASTQVETPKDQAAEAAADKKAATKDEVDKSLHDTALAIIDARAKLKAAEAARRPNKTLGAVRRSVAEAVKRETTRSASARTPLPILALRVRSSRHEVNRGH